MTYPEVKLQISAKDPFTEISLIGGKLQLLKKGFSFLEARVNPGIFKIRYSSGGNMDEQLIRVTGDQPSEMFKQEATLLASAAPLNNSIDSTKRSSEEAQEITKNFSRNIKQGDSSIFVFYREKLCARQQNQWNGPLANALIDVDVLDSQYQPIRQKLDIEEPKAFDQTSGERIHSIILSVKPGSYILRITDHINEYYQALYVVHGWQTQVFVYKPDEKQYSETVSINMVRPQEGFDPESEMFHWAEQARQGLASRFSSSRGDRLQSSLATSPENNLHLLKIILREKFNNPMLGLFAAQLMLQANNFDRPLLEEVAQNLKTLVGDIPDVVSIFQHLNEKGPPVQNYKSKMCSFPPMLAGSWSTLVRCSGSELELVQKNSLASSIAFTTLQKDGWLCWRKTNILQLITKINLDFKTLVNCALSRNELLTAQNFSLREIIRSVGLDEEDSEFIMAYLAPILSHIDEITAKLEANYIENFSLILAELQNITEGKGNKALGLDPKTLVQVTNLPWSSICELVQAVELMLTNIESGLKIQNKKMNSDLPLIRKSPDDERPENLLRELSTIIHCVYERVCYLLYQPNLTDQELSALHQSYITLKDSIRFIHSDRPIVLHAQTDFLYSSIVELRKAEMRPDASAISATEINEIMHITAIIAAVVAGMSM